MNDTTPGLVCGHHHLYSSLARGMPAPPKEPGSFLDVLNQVWWRLDAALDLEMIYWSAMLGATEALMSGTTCIIDHHESPNAIEGSLDAIQRACDTVGVRVIAAYGVTDRWQDDGSLVADASLPKKMTKAATRGLTEIKRHADAGHRTMVGIHAAFTCSDDTLQASTDLAQDLGVGVHIHVSEGREDADAAARLRDLAGDNWLLVHCVHLSDDLRGTIAHNPRSNMNNAVGYAQPARFKNRVILGTDGIGADMMEEARLAYVANRADDIHATPETSWSWLANGSVFFPDAQNDLVTWNYDHMDDPWHLAFTTGVKPISITADGKQLLANGIPSRVDLHEVRAKAAEQSKRLHAKLAA